MENNEAALFYAGYEVNENNPDSIKFANKPVFQITLSTLCSKEESGASVSSLHNGLLGLRHTKTFQPAGKYEFNRYYYLCLFEERFLPEIFRENLKQLHLFTEDDTREIILSGSTFGAASQLFIKVIAEQHCGYPHKYDLIRIYITQLVHLAMKTDVVE